jgi:hypothetical protein
MFRVGCLTARCISAARISSPSAAVGRHPIGSKPSHRLRAFVVLSALAYLGSFVGGAAAFGQPGESTTPSSGLSGAGLGAIALSQSILGSAHRAAEQPARASSTVTTGVASRPEHPGSAVAATPNAAPDATATPARMTPDQIDAALGYEPDPEISVEIREHEIDAGAAQDPAYRPLLEQAFADDAALRQFDALLEMHGCSSHNLADAIAGLMWTSWQFVNDTTLTDTQIRGIHQQIRAIFLANPNLPSLTAEARQRLSENAAYRVMIARAAMRADDPAVLEKSRHNIAVIVRNIVDLDLAQLDVTPDGQFSRKDAAVQ